MSKACNLYTLEDLQAKAFRPWLALNLIAPTFHNRSISPSTGYMPPGALLKMERFADSLLAVTGEGRSAMANYISTDTQNGFDDHSMGQLGNNLTRRLPPAAGVIGSNPAQAQAEEARNLLDAFGSILYALGLELYTVETPKQEAPEEILALAQQRWEAKQARDWKKADALRDEILAAGWVVKDSKDGFEVVLS